MSNGVEYGINGLDRDETVVCKPGTVCKRPPHQRHLVITRSWFGNCTAAPSAKFLALTAQVGINEAQSLRWLVENIVASSAASYWTTPARPPDSPMSYP
jgi:hypothetical protein